MKALMSMSMKVDENNSRLSEISDIPIPSKSVIDLEKTLIFGKGDDWMGRIIFDK